MPSSRLPLDAPDNRAIWSVKPGEIWAVMGESEQAVAQLLNGLAEAGARFAEPLSKRRTLKAILGRSARGAEILGACGLWERRQQTQGSLAAIESQLAEVAALLVSDADIGILDGHLDRLPPRRLDAVLAMLDETRGWAIATGRPDIAERLGRVCWVSEGGQVQFAGTVDELFAAIVTDEVFIESSDRTAVRALVEPFALQIEEQPDGLRVSARAGQELAAHLLTHGYGTVEAVVVRRQTLVDVLRVLDESSSKNGQF